jgi:hypothetical protein
LMTTNGEASTPRGSTCVPHRPSPLCERSPGATMPLPAVPGVLAKVHEERCEGTLDR